MITAIDSRMPIRYRVFLLIVRILFVRNRVSGWFIAAKPVIPNYFLLPGARKNHFYQKKVEKAAVLLILPLNRWAELPAFLFAAGKYHAEALA